MNNSNEHLYENKMYLMHAQTIKISLGSEIVVFSFKNQQV